MKARMIALSGLTKLAVSIGPMLVLLPADAIHLLAEGATMPAHADDRSGAKPAATMPLARDPSAAVQEEYQMARKSATPQALELFIARHPDSPQAQRAREDLTAMKR